MSDAKNSRAQARSGAGIWLDQHLYSVVSSLGRAVRRPWATLLTVGVMAVAFALPLGLWLALQNVGHFAGDVQQSREIDLFLTPETPVARAQALAETLRARDDADWPIRWTCWTATRCRPCWWWCPKATRRGWSPRWRRCRKRTCSSTMRPGANV